jgi:hypothetical protein
MDSGILAPDKGVGNYIVRAWNEDTPEADELWIKTMAELANLLQRQVATCLLERGRL